VRVLETPRLVLRRFAAGDAAFILRLVNEPPRLRCIGERGVRTLEDGRGYALESGAAVIDWARESLGLNTLVAITTENNHRAEILLDRLGFEFGCNTRLDDVELRLFRHTEPEKRP